MRGWGPPFQSPAWSARCGRRGSWGCRRRSSRIRAWVRLTGRCLCVCPGKHGVLSGGRGAERGGPALAAALGSAGEGSAGARQEKGSGLAFSRAIQRQRGGPLPPGPLPGTMVGPRSPAPPRRGEGASWGGTTQAFLTSHWAGGNLPWPKDAKYLDRVEKSFGKCF